MLLVLEELGTWLQRELAALAWSRDGCDNGRFGWKSFLKRGGSNLGERVWCGGF